MKEYEKKNAVKVSNVSFEVTFGESELKFKLEDPFEGSSESYLSDKKDGKEFSKETSNGFKVEAFEGGISLDKENMKIRYFITELDFQNWDKSTSDKKAGEKEETGDEPPTE